MRSPTVSKLTPRVRPDGPEAVRSPAIPLSVPELRGNEWQYLKACLDSGWVSSVGPFVERFECEMARYTGASHAVAVINGTAALHMALLIIGVKPDDEVLVSDLTFIAPVNAIRYCQAHPILVDAHPQTWQMDVEKVQRFLEEVCEVRGDHCYNTRTDRRVHAILPVHVLGLACDMDRLLELARRYHLRIVEDAAEGIGVRYRGRHVGTFGDVGCLSFNGNKLMTTGGGGMLLMNDQGSAERARYLTTQAKDDALEYIHHEVGYNYRLTNVQAALGVAQLEQLEEFIARKCAIAKVYEEAFQDVDGITPMPTPPHTEPTYWLYTILLDSHMTLAERQARMKQLHADGIGVRPLWHPIHGLAPYRQCQTVAIEHSIRLYERAISLPSSVGLTDEELRRCVRAVRKTVGIQHVFR